MVRKIWIASMLVALTGAGFSLNYLAMAAVPVQEKAKDRIITVTEQGQSPRKCKVLRTWSTTDGNRAFHVEALDNGEYLTVVTQQENSLTKIYHWQNHKTPPKNCPIPPEQSQTNNASKIVEAKPAINKKADLPMQTAVTTSKSPVPIALPTMKSPEPKPSQPTEFVTIPAPGADKVVDANESKKKALTKAPVAKPAEPQKTIASSQNVGRPNPLTFPRPTQDKVIVIKEEKTLVKTEVGKEKVIAVTSIPSQKPVMEKPAEAKVATTTPSKAVETPKVQAPSPIPKSIETKVVDAPKTTKPTEPVKEKVAPTKAPEKVIVENPKPQDWRKSWGKMDDVVAKPNFKPSADVELPHADSTKPDPLKTPDQFHPTLEEKVARRAEKVLGKDNGKKELEKLTSPTPAKTTAQLAEGQPPRTIAPSKKITPPAEKVVIIKEDSIPQSKKTARPTVQAQEKTPGLDIFDKTIGRLIGLRESTPRPFANAGRFKLGTRSVADSGYDTEFAIPYGQMGRPPMPTAFMPPPAPPMNVPQAPQIYPDTPAPATMIARTPTQGMANAFTDVPNQRPIPADMEATVNMQNAFQQPYNPQQEMQAAQAAALAMAYQAQRSGQAYAYIPSQVNPYQAVLVEQMVALKTSLQPSQREFAAEQLGQLSLRGNPEVIQTLVQGVRNDPAPTVRAACIRSLTRMKIHTIETMDLFRGMKSDQDPRVRLEADKALIQQTSASR